ncbi:hypothetical protein Nmel_018479 [Mimus melanotis]
MGRVRLLSHLLADSFPVQAGQNEDSGAASRQIQIPILGKLLGHLFLKFYRTEETTSMVVEILCSLMIFLSEQKCATLPEGHAQPPSYWESEITSLAFGRYLRLAQRTGVVLVAIEILGHSSLLDKKAPMEFLEVPKIVRHIFVYCDDKNTTTAHSFYSLLALMVNKWPGQVVATALDVVPRFSDKVCLWKAMFSVRQTLEKVLKELQIQVQDLRKNLFTRQQKSCLTFLSMLAYSDVLDHKVGPLYKNLSLLGSPRREMVPLVLRALVMLSERARQ